MWRVWLTAWGFTVEEAVNGADAVRTAHAHPPDLVLMDLCMPVLDGLEATRALKADPITAGVPVIALSAIHPMAASDVSNAGCHTYLPKPLVPEELLQALRVALKRPPD
jgi:CheY-like chemotaxis protein